MGCFARYAGDIAAILSHPVMVIRILRGDNDGLSITSQLLHVVLFSLRYADKESWFPRTLEHIQWVAIKHVIVIAGAVAVPIAMECRARTGGRTVLSRAKISKVLPEMLKYMVLAFLIAYRINYTSFSWVPGKTWTPQNLPGSPLAILLSYFSVKDLINMDKRQAYEVLWSTSIFLAAIADIPQYITYYRHVRTKVDGWLMSSLELAAMSRIFYMIHWISVYGHLHISDPISF
ncbi:hypothetical protein FRC19_006102, partial [Serendipita sp. 401]